MSRNRRSSSRRFGRRHTAPQRSEPFSPNYDVGYGRPPRHTQYTRGQSGNPRGRAKKRASLQDIVTKVLLEPIEVRTGERTQKVASVEALVRMAMTRALRGDHKFMTSAIGFIRMSGLCDIGVDSLAAETDLAADQAILADFLRREEAARAAQRSESSTCSPVNEQSVSQANGDSV